MAIARDTFTNGGFASSTTRTFSHTCSGSDRILFVHAFKNSNTDTITGVTYAGTAMTLVDKDTSGADRYGYVFVLINPATGANNVVITSSSSTAIGGNAASYTGVSQTGQPEVTNKRTATSDPDTISLTTTTDNSWTVLFNIGNNTDPTASTGSTLYGQNGTYGDADVFDSNAAITPAGSYSMTLDFASASNHVMIMVAIAPVGGGGGGATFIPNGQWL